MSTNAHTTAQLGDMVAGAFDWAAQCDSDPRHVSFLAARAVEYILQRACKESASSHVSGFLSLVDFRALAVIGAAGGRPGPWTFNEVDVG